MYTLRVAIESITQRKGRTELKKSKEEKKETEGCVTTTTTTTTSKKKAPGRREVLSGPTEKGKQRKKTKALHSHSLDDLRFQTTIHPILSHPFRDEKLEKKEVALRDETL